MAQASVPDLSKITDLAQLMTYTRDTQPAVRRQAVARIGTLQDVPAEIVKELGYRGARENVDLVQKEFVNTIVALGGPAASDALQHIAKFSSFEKIRRDARYGEATVAARVKRLAKQTDADVINGLLGELRLGGTWKDRLAAAQQLKDCESLDGPTIKRMMDIGAKETVSSIRTQILDGIEKHGGVAALTTLSQSRLNKRWTTEGMGRLKIVKARLKAAANELKDVANPPKQAAQKALKAA